MSAIYPPPKPATDPSDGYAGTSAPRWYPAGIPPTHRGFNWPWFVAVAAYILWQVLTKGVLSLVYVTLIADGLKQFIAPLNMRLYKAVPFLSFLQDYEATHRIDLSHPASLLLMVFVWVAWTIVLIYWFPELGDSSTSFSGKQRSNDVFVTLAAILLIGEACLFYLSMVRVTWSGAAFSVSAVLGTIVYCATVLFSVLYSLKLSRKCAALSRKEH